MLLQLALAATLAAVSADPRAPGTYTPRTLPDAYQQAKQSPYLNDQAVGPGGEHVGQDGGDGGCQSCGGAGYWHNCGPQSSRCHFFFSPCNMPSYFPYWNKERGYYYFRPYHVAHVLQQQEKAAGWGGDPRNPYDNRNLDKLFDEWAEEQELLDRTKSVEDLPRVMPMEEGEEPKKMPEETPTPPKPEVDPEPKPEPEEPKLEQPKPDGSKRSSQLKKFVTFR